MSTKGTSKNCCCDGCSAPPLNPVSDSLLQITNSPSRLCCACVPSQFALEYVSGDTKLGCCLLTIDQHCAGGDSSSAWTGKLYTSELLHFSLYLLPNTPFDGCSLCLSCYELEIAGQCLVIDDTMRSVMCTTCQTCANPFDNPFATFTFSGGTINIRRAANTSITPTNLAYGCPDPCAEPYAEPSPYGSDCGGLCSGCGCICTAAAITVLVNGQVVGTDGGQLAYGALPYALKPLCKGAYGDQNLQIVVTHDDSGCCVLKLTKFGKINVGHLQPVGIGGLTGNPCPNPTASWVFADPHAYTPTLYEVHFNCAGCDGSPLRINDGGCCPNPLPETLSCEVTMTPACMCPDLGPIDEVFELVHSELISAWQGAWTNGCNVIGLPAPMVNSIRVTIGCDGQKPPYGPFTCRVQILDQDLSIPFSESSSCNPVEGVFSFHGTLTAFDCQLVGGSPLPCTITVRFMG